MLLIVASLIIALVLLLLGLPVGFAFALAAIFFIFTGDVSFFASPSYFGLSIYRGINVFVWMAIPLFILMGDLMRGGGLSDRLVDFVKLFVGKLKGGLGAVTVIASGIFGAVSGSTMATVAAIGGVMIPKLVEKGYTREHATALATSSALLGILIPPSIPVIIFCGITGVSVGALFLATVGPAILIAVGCIIINRFLYIKAMTETKSKGDEEIWFWEDWRRAERTLMRTALTLLLPVIVLGSIFSGIASPTESAALGVFGALIIGLLHRQLTRQHFLDFTKSAVLTTSAILILIGLVTPLGQIFMIQGFGKEVSNALNAISTNPYIQIIFVNLIVLLFGSFLESTALQFLLIPVLFPIVTQLGWNPIHFGAFFVINVGVGMQTPPFAYTLFIGARIGGVSVYKVLKPLTPYLLWMVIVLFIATYWPDLCLWLPKLILG